MVASKKISPFLNMNKTNMKKTRAYILIEVLIAILLLIIVSAAMFHAYGSRFISSDNTMHKLEAIHFAGSAAEKILELSKEPGAGKGDGSGPGELSFDITHNSSNTPSISTLPECYFKNTLNGKLEYKVTDEGDIRIKSRDYNIVKVDIKIYWNDAKIVNKTYTESIYLYFISQP